MEREAYGGTWKIRNGVVECHFLYKNYGTLNEAGRSQKGGGLFTYKLENSCQGVYKFTWVQVNTE